MIIYNCKVSNFGSYKNLELDFHSLGLALIQGKTGSGKSTLPDMVTWGLYGQTAKGGVADDIRPWTSEEVTRVEIVTDKLVITRLRGKGANDLFFTNSDNLVRGKDLKETQKLLDAAIGVDYETFIAGSYYNEFSPTASFFTATAKARRELFEKLTNLDLPAKLSEKAQEAKKSTKTKILNLEAEYSKVTGKHEQVTEQLMSAITNAEKWEKDRAKRILNLEKLSNNFEDDKNKELTELTIAFDDFENNRLVSIKTNTNKIQEATLELANLDKESKQECPKCPTCGRRDNMNESWQTRVNELTGVVIRAGYVISQAEGASNPNFHKSEAVKNKTNVYSDRLQSELATINPWHAEQEKVKLSRIGLETKCSEVKTSLDAQNDHLNAFNDLYDISSILRGELLKNVIRAVNDKTNEYLDEYFDAELRVTFEVDSSDNLEVIIHKSGNECNYKQLSKGQRGLLKLCFSVAVMGAVSDACGIHFSNLWLDESLDGLDGELKNKAFSLFQSLEANHESIVVIDHAEAFQNMFSKKFLVTMESDNSHIQEVT